MIIYILKKGRKNYLLGDKGIDVVEPCFLIVTMNFKSGNTIRKCPSHTRRNGLKYSCCFPFVHF